MDNLQDECSAVALQLGATWMQQLTDNFMKGLLDARPELAPGELSEEDSHYVKTCVESSVTFAILVEALKLASANMPISDLVEIVLTIISAVTGIAMDPGIGSEANSN